MRIVITGASGNVGSALLRRLAQDGGHDLVGRGAPPPPRPRAVRRRRVGTARPHRRDDAAGPPRGLRGRGRGRAPGLGLPAVPRRGLPRGARGRRHPAGHRGGAAAGVPHLVHMSSVGAYSPKRDDEPVDESWPTDGVPTSPYSRHKAAAERLLDEHEARRAAARWSPGCAPASSGSATAGSALLRYGVPALGSGAAARPRAAAAAGPRAGDPDGARRRRRRRGRAGARPEVGGAFNLAAEPPITTDGSRACSAPGSCTCRARSCVRRCRCLARPPAAGGPRLARPRLRRPAARHRARRAPSSAGRPTTRLPCWPRWSRACASGAADLTPVLRPRTVADALGRFAHRGPVSDRQLP